ncbi:MAG: WecB/TagA/CpsF family glycosyltransferase [Dysgonamonadaceae bacterium]
MKKEIQLCTLKLLKSKSDLANLPERKMLINTINAHSYNTARKDHIFANALLGGDVLIPDGAGIVWAFKILRRETIQRIAGWDLFQFEMKKLNQKGGVCFFLGSSEKTLAKIKERASVVYPNIRLETYSPPYKPTFSDDDNFAMIEAVNKVNPDLLWIGMTAPKQEKWAFEHFDSLNVKGHIGTIGAVFDFFAGTIERAPIWWQENSLEWAYRLLKEPRRMWKRYIIGNAKFMGYIIEESYFVK